MSDTQFHLRLSAELMEWVKEQAAADRRSVNSYIVKALEERRPASPKAREVERVANTVPVTTKALRDRDLVGKVPEIPGVVKATALLCRCGHAERLHPGSARCVRCACQSYRPTPSR